MGLLTPLAIRIGAISWKPRFLPQITWTDNGIRRTTPLLCVPYGADILIAGSYFGGPKEPIWVKNVEANPDVSVRFRRREMAVVARRLEGDDRAAAWSHMVETWPNFAKYEKRTERRIKVFQLNAS